MRSYIDRGYTVVKKKIGGASLDEDLRRIDAILSVLRDGRSCAVDANGRFDLDTAIAYAKALSQYDLFWYEEAGDPLDYRIAGDAAQLLRQARWRPAKTCSHAGCAQPDPLRRHASRSRLAAIRLRA